MPPRPLMPSRPSEQEPATRSPLSAVDEGRFKRGQLLHRLLQVLPDLPQERRREAGLAFLARPVHGLASGLAERYVDEIMGVLEHPDWAGLFAAGSRAEVAYRWTSRNRGRGGNRCPLVRSIACWSMMTG